MTETVAMPRMDFATYQSRPGPAAIPMAFVRAIYAGYLKYGADPSEAFQRAQIRPSALSDPEGRVTAAQFEALSWVAMRELDDEALGWFSRKLPWGSYGLLCRASITSATLGLALRRWTRHHRLLIDDILLHLNVAEGVATLSLEERSDLGEFREFCLVTLLRYALGYICWAVDFRIPLSSADFPFPPPPHAEVYGKLFSDRLNFGASRAAIAFDARYLDLPLQRDEAALNKMLKRAIPLTVLPYRRDQHLTARVEQVLRMPTAKLAGAQDIAEAFHISIRTLHRQLQKEGASLRQLQEKARMDRAQQALAVTIQPIKRVAFATGFENEKSFSRAFRRWTGETPSAYRTRVKGARAEAALAPLAP